MSVPIGGNIGVAQEILRGVAQAQKEVNDKGGINGMLLQVEIANDDNDPNIAKQIATEFVQDNGIWAVVGHNTSDVSISAAHVYQGRLVMISPTSLSDSLSQIAIDGYIFRTVPSVRFITDPLAEYAVKKAGKSNIGICVDSTARDNTEFVSHFQSALFNEGGKLINIDCNLSLNNLKPSNVVSQAINKGADSLLLAPYVGRIQKALDVAKAVAQSNKANNKQLTLLGSLTMYTGETLKVGQADVNGLVLATPWRPDATPGNRFLDDATKLWHAPVSWRTAMAYDATKAIIEGLKQSKTRDELQRVLHRESFSGAAGNFQFLPNGNRNGTAKLLRVQPNLKSSSSYNYKFVTFQP